MADVAIIARLRLARIQNRLTPISSEPLQTQTSLPLSAHARSPVETRHFHTRAMQLTRVAKETGSARTPELAGCDERAVGAILAGVQRRVARVAMLTGASVESDVAVAKERCVITTSTGSTAAALCGVGVVARNHLFTQPALEPHSTAARETGSGKRRSACAGASVQAHGAEARVNLLAGVTEVARLAVTLEAQ